MSPQNFDLNIGYMFAMTIFSLGLYCIIIKKNFIKKIIGLGIMTNSIHLFLLSIGFREGGLVPIVTSLSELITFSNFAVDPLPQAMVLTSIVIDISITALALTIAVKVYEHFKTLNTEMLRELRE